MRLAIALLPAALGLALGGCAPLLGPGSAGPGRLYTDGHLYGVRHFNDAAPAQVAKSVDDTVDSGFITGRVCGMDVVYFVELDRGVTVLTGFVDGELPSRIEVHDHDGERLIFGYIGQTPGTGTIDLRMTRDHLAGQVATRRYQLQAAGNALSGPMSMGGGDPTRFVAEGREQMWSLPPADQAVIVPAMLACSDIRGGNFRPLPEVNFNRLDGATALGR